MELVVVTVATLLGTLFALEAKAWLPRLSRRLVAGAVARFPAEIGAEDRDRWAQEIGADLEAFDDRPLGGFLFALGVRFKGGRDLAAQLALAEKLAEPERAPEAEAPPSPKAADEVVTARFVGGRAYMQGVSIRFGGISPAAVRWIRRRGEDAK